MERSFEKEFEDYFEEDLAEVDQDPEEIAQTLLHLSEATDTKPGVLWAVPREDHLHLVLILPGGKPIVRDLYDVPRSKLLKTVEAFQQQIDDPNQWDLQLAQQLHQWILGPYEKEHLEVAEIDTLLFCLGKGLRGVPLAALHDGQSYLVERYSLTAIPAFNLIQTDYQPRKTRKILAAGASQFLRMNSLPSVPTEISTILTYLRSQLSNQSQWQGQSLLNRDFTLANLKEQLYTQNYNIVHLATHAEFNPGQPQQSFIQLRDTRLSLDQMNTINWSKLNLDLLVLSACKTALGDDSAELGFAGIALKSGVKTALGSLWYVSDLGTLAIMNEFYQQLPQWNTKAQALRQAQLGMLRGKVHVNDGRIILSNLPVQLPKELADMTNVDFSHPFYWSGFTMLSSPW
ncbi:CHAT domain-containing protein [Acaryochloris sp. IP29b_bin.137]|uniref:CHAT domain-containing protein n=1 Tax=Acaryochloris sp. IP29b_bin.137 TaxID=2969217 RepID=UPI0026020E01|nr:CHAT domain-containing protein [Acaryochloris sp. IP29b_bin.137]